MTELDLSRLTDKERSVYDFCKTYFGDSYFDKFDSLTAAQIDEVFAALIAARAENKRKDEQIAEMRQFDLREYEYWTGLRWQIVSPHTMTLRKRG